MTPEAQRIAIAQACHAIQRINGEWFYAAHIIGEPAWNKCAHNDPLNDLNAMHEAEKVLQEYMGKWWNYVSQLAVLSARLGHGGEAHATAAQRAEAFLRTLNLWRDDK